ncbi:MAG: hypothetical protein WCV72_04645 [Patescibacteria group bacterium]|jgi:hypothetical protein
METPRSLSLSNRFKKIVDSIRDQLSGTISSQKFEHSQPIPHEIIVRERRTGKLDLRLSFKNPSGEKITALQVAIDRSTTGDKFTEIRFPQPSNTNQVRFAPDKNLGPITDVRIDKVSYFPEKNDFYGLEEQQSA